MNPKSVMLRACVAVIGAQDPVDPSGSKSGNVRTLFPSEGNGSRSRRSRACSGSRS